MVELARSSPAEMAKLIDAISITKEVNISVQAKVVFGKHKVLKTKVVLKRFAEASLKGYRRELKLFTLLESNK